MSMTTDRWLLPDGINEVLPGRAGQLENLRRRLLDQYAGWGYELVIPPLLEFTENLLVDTNPDLDLQTFKVTDQLSGRTMGVRADITPQAARIAAHSLKRQGPVRLCYSGHVLHTRPIHARAPRSPVQTGVECFGISELFADIEVISLMIDTVRSAGINNITLSLGHVEVFRSLCKMARLDKQQTETVLDILQRKARADLEAFLVNGRLSKPARSVFEKLIAWHGDTGILLSAKKVLQDISAPAADAISELQSVVDAISARYPSIRIYVDLAELPGYHYHNGIVFAAYAQGAGVAVANGGRYDALSELFGRSFPATGFNADLMLLLDVAPQQESARDGILVVIDGTPEQWAAIQDLRKAGDRVICVSRNQKNMAIELGCDRLLERRAGRYITKHLNR